MGSNNILSDVEFEENVIGSNCILQNNNEHSDLSILLEEIEKSDNLEDLCDIEAMPLSEINKLTSALNNTTEQNMLLKDEINTGKSLIKELEKLQSDENLKIEEIRENIKLKQAEMLHYQNQQIDDLDQFEEEIHKISQTIVTAPKQYESNYLNERIAENKGILNEKWLHLQQLTEKVTEAKCKFEEPIEFVSMDILEKILDDATDKLTSSNNRLPFSMKKISTQVDKLHFDIKASNIAKNQDKYN